MIDFLSGSLAQLLRYTAPANARRTVSTPPLEIRLQALYLNQIPRSKWRLEASYRRDGLKTETDFVSRKGAKAQRTDEKMEKGLQGVGVVVWFG